MAILFEKIEIVTKLCLIDYLQIVNKILYNLLATRRHIVMDFPFHIHSITR